MKKYVLISLLLLLSLFCCSCVPGASSQDTAENTLSTSQSVTPITSSITQKTSDSSGTTGYQDKRFVFSNASYEYKVGTLARLEAHSTEIVQVTVLPGSKEIRSNTPDLTKAITPSSHVLTPVRIDRIYLDDGKFIQGDTIIIEEYYGTATGYSDPKTISTFIFIQTFCLPMIEGEQYLLFLQPPMHEGDYCMVRGDMGKYVYNDATRNATDIKQLSEDDLEIGREADGAHVPQEYYDVAAEVIAKYMQDKS